jgi:site-specific recombinase XerD
MKKQPIPLFDKAEHLDQPITDCLNQHLKSTGIKTIKHEFELCKQFLLNYRGSPDTYNAYRREVERLCQWAWWIHQGSLLTLTRNHILNYIDFASMPPKAWISTQSRPRFIDQNGVRTPHPEWRPFLIRPKKIDVKKGHHRISSKQYLMSDATLRALFAGMSTFFTYLQQEQVIQHHPVQSIRQKSRFFKKTQVKRVSRTLSMLQWRSIIGCTQQHAEQQPAFERHLFILSIFYLLGLRISELVPTHRHVPIMGDFFKDQHGLWWFVTVGKGHKEREIAVPDTLLTALIRYRTHLGLSTRLPTRGESTPLLPKIKGHGSIGLRQLRKIVQECFDLAIEYLENQHNIDSADELSAATTHWLRHTAISVDVQHRPRAHVRDDVGHETMSVTDLYVDIERKERHRSAQNKTLLPTENP